MHAWQRGGALHRAALHNSGVLPPSPETRKPVSSPSPAQAPIRILQVHNSYRQRGGEDEVVGAEAELLRMHGHPVELFAATNQSIGNPLAVLGQVIWNQSSYRSLRSTIERFRPAVVHVHNTFPVISPAALYAATAEKVPVVHTLHNYRLLCPAATFYRDGHVCEDCVLTHTLLPSVLHSCYRESRATTAVAAVTLRAHRIARSWKREVAAYIALTEFARSKFIESGSAPDRIHVKPNFIGTDPGVGTGEGNYALYVGRLTEEKGIRTLLEAWRRVDAKHSLEIIGEGPLAALVQEATNRLPNLKLHGWMTKAEVLGKMQRAAMLVMPSEWYEGFPVTLVEAFATGLPAVVSRLGSLASLVRHGETGLQFSPGDAAQLADSMRSLFDNPDLLARMRSRGREEYQKKYTADANYIALSNVYRTVIERKINFAAPVS